MAVQYAKFRTHTCPLADDRCFQRVLDHWLALCSFDRQTVEADLEARIPRYVKGPKKGLRKGTASISECYEGGWVRDGYGHGHVVYPGRVAGIWLGIENAFEHKTFATIGVN